MHKTYEDRYATITGENIYSGSDTILYFGSGVSGQEAEINLNSFNESNSQVQIRIPSGLSDKYLLTIDNGVDQFTPSLYYKFIGKPVVSGVYPQSQRWGEEISIKGNYFLDTKSIKIGGSGVSEFFVENERKIIAKVPQDLPTGNNVIELSTEIGETEGAVSVEEPPIYAEVRNPSGLGYGDLLTLSNGKALHKVNRVVVSGINGFINVDNLTKLGSSGLSFVVPVGALSNKPIKLQKQSGYFSQGEYIQTVFEEYETTDNLIINSTYITNIETASATYGKNLRVSGINLYGAKILFNGYPKGQNNYVEAPIVNTGETYVDISVPRGVIEGGLISSGYSGNVSGIHTSNNNFYPLPTISSIDSSNWVVGNQIQIEAINATEMVHTIGFTGTNILDSGNNGFYFVSNSSLDSDTSFNYFGDISVNNSSLLDSLETGVTKISAIINSTLVGSGNPFLIPSQEINSKNINDYLNELSGKNALLNINEITGEHVNLTSKQPIILGIDKPRTNRDDEITISGQYFTTATGAKLYNNSESSIIPISQFEKSNNQLHSKVNLVQTGQVSNGYEVMNTVKIDLENFVFSAKSGTIELLKS
tara:strand:- start:1993 stop:3768 length:1776 start_codon:yes stop_codon:yes gene_type:complete